jgi:hypothetical protein
MEEELPGTEELEDMASAWLVERPDRGVSNR